MNFVENLKIMSGGQTGVDRGALEAAIELGFPHGGWCPKGRKAEDGVISHHFNLFETNSAAYTERTIKNIKHSDGTLVIVVGGITRGSYFTVQKACELNKPVFLINLELESLFSKELIQRWVRDFSITRLNVAGSRESIRKGIQAKTKSFLVAKLG